MAKGGYKIKSSLGMFDFTRGMVMLLILFLHTYGMTDYIAEHILEFNYVVIALIVVLMFVFEALLPIMFILYGYGFRHTSFQKCLKRQAKSLLIPYVITAAVTLFLHPICFYLIYGGAKESVKRTLSITGGMLFGFTESVELFGVSFSSCGPIWFLLALFTGGLIFNELLGKFEGKKLLLASLITSCIGWGLSFVKFIPWCISQSLVVTIYICFGYLAKKNKLYVSGDNKPVKTWGVVTVGIVALVIRLLLGERAVAISTNIYPLGPISVLVSAIIAMYVIYGFLQFNRFNGKTSNVIRTIGRYCLYVYCVHAVEYMAAGAYLHYDFVNSYKGSVITRSLIIFGCRITVVFLATFLFVKIRQFIVSQSNKKLSAGG